MRRFLIAGMLLLGPATSAQAQVATPFQNLKVLPADISRDSLTAIMRGFTGALGVRCVYCHVGQDTGNLDDLDFKADDKATKRTAREMMRMAGSINQTLASLPDRSAPNVGVSCMTCHRGVPRPVPLEDSIYRVAAARGGAQAVAQYDSLRARYHGRAAYDFGPNALFTVAARLFAEQRHEDAVLVLRRNAGAFPQQANNWFELGRNLEALNRRDEAIAAYRAVLERQPNHMQAQARLRALGVQPPRP